MWWWSAFGQRARFSGDAFFRCSNIGIHMWVKMCLVHWIVVAIATTKKYKECVHENDKLFFYSSCLWPVLKCGLVLRQWMLYEFLVFVLSVSLLNPCWSDSIDYNKITFPRSEPNQSYDRGFNPPDNKKCLSPRSITKLHHPLLLIIIDSTDQ